MNKMQKGFTLIELMIVIAIIAILAAIALPAYQDYVVKSQVAEGSVLADGVKTAVAEFEANTGRWPPNNTSAGLALSTSIVGSYVSKVTVAGGVIVANYGGVRANAAIPAGSTISFSPSTTGGAVSWICRGETAGGNLPAKYLPTSCRQ